MSLSSTARRVSATLDVAAALAAATSIGFVVCALMNGADQSCIDRVFWSLCVGASALLAAIAIDHANPASR